MFFDGAHGWNIDIDAQSSVLNQVRQSLFTTVGWKGLVRMKRICTLLGPEGPERSGQPGWTFPLDLFRSAVVLFGVAGRKGYRPYFENYTVDASILNLNPSGSNYKDQHTFRSV